jgi:ATP-dependent phosphofructokinase / diphosphate-dependent phosphofructokinase
MARRSAPSSSSGSASALVGNAAIGQSGGPTAVINQSLVGAVEQLRTFKHVKKIFGMRHGVSGLIKGQLVDLTKTPMTKLNAIASSPAAALGSSRDKPDAEYCKKIVEACKTHNIRYYFYIGGNDSSDTCRIVNELANSGGYTMRCFHIPKTVDNDLMLSDHTPGFASAARFVATAFMADALDNASLPGVKINIVMGRHAGFLTGASVLARGLGDPKAKPASIATPGDNGPHLIFLPEVPFDTKQFVADVQRVYDRLGRCQVAVSEGIQDKAGQAITTLLVQGLEKDAHGNVQLSGVGGLGDGLSDLVKKHVKTSAGKAPRVRGDTFGYLQRCWPDASVIDQKEARAAAKFAVKLAQAGHLSGSVAIVRAPGKRYAAAYKRIELTDVAAKTRHMPADFISGTNNVSAKFVEYLTPLVGTLPRLAKL